MLDLEFLALTFLVDTLQLNADLLDLLFREGSHRSKKLGRLCGIAGQLLVHNRILLLPLESSRNPLSAANAIALEGHLCMCLGLTITNTKNDTCQPA